MTRSECDVLVEERANRILTDNGATAAHADYVEDQLRRRTAAQLEAVIRVLASVIAWIAGLLGP